MTTAMEGPLGAIEHQIEIERFMREVATTARSALLLDYDGTLAPFTENRRRAFPYPGITALLKEIMDSGKTRVVIVTGRSAGEMSSLLGPELAPEIWGSHGFERLRPDGRSETPPLDPDVSRAFEHAGQWLAEHGLQHLTEFKPGGIAVHWRGLSESRAGEVREKVLRAWFPVIQDSGLSLLEFDGGVEMRVPDSSKGDAVQTIMAEMEASASIAFLGDDATDERAFAAINGRGLSILVRPQWRRTLARLWLKPPQEVLDFLVQWRQACCIS